MYRKVVEFIFFQIFIIIYLFVIYCELITILFIYIHHTHARGECNSVRSGNVGSTDRGD